MRFEIRSENGIHPGLIASTPGLEPSYNVSVKPHREAFFWALRKNHSCSFPEVRIHGDACGSIFAGPVFH